MPKFRKKAKVSQEIPTSALPDIIFILLFFFMVVTKPRPQEPKVAVELSPATEIQKVPEQMVTINLHVGKPKDDKFGKAHVIQAGKGFIPVQGLKNFLSEEIHKKSALPSRTMVIFNVDKGVKAGMLHDIKQELRDIGLLNIEFKASPRNEDL